MQTKYQQEYYQKNKERLKKYKKNWYQKNKKRIDKKHEEYRQNNPIKVWCQCTITSHKRKYKVFFTTKELYKIANNTKYCSICNTELEYGKKRSSKNSTLDRINNEKTLTLNNIQILCHRCNTMKQNLTMKEFIKYCETVYNKFKSQLTIGLQYF